MKKRKLYTRVLRLEHEIEWMKTAFQMEGISKQELSEKPVRDHAEPYSSFALSAGFGREDSPLRELSKDEVAYMKRGMEGAENITRPPLSQDEVDALKYDRADPEGCEHEMVFFGGDGKCQKCGHETEPFEAWFARGSGNLCANNKDHKQDGWEAGVEWQKSQRSIFDEWLDDPENLKAYCIEKVKEDARNDGYATGHRDGLHAAKSKYEEQPPPEEEDMDGKSLLERQLLMATKPKCKHGAEEHPLVKGKFNSQTFAPPEEEG